jgi:crotonobetainyl-CoA:carnitine CoA-transferase CaiB-like acyl-CoA transferase
MDRAGFCHRQVGSPLLAELGADVIRVEQADAVKNAPYRFAALKRQQIMNYCSNIGQEYWEVT